MHADDCTAARAALVRGAVDDPALRAHVVTCEACAILAATPEIAPALDAAGRSDTEAVADPAALDGLRRALARERGPRAWLVSRPTWARVLLALLAATPLLVYLLLKSGPRADLPRFPAGRMVLGAVGLLALAAWNVALALRGPHRAGAGPTRALGWAALAALVAATWAALPAPYAQDPALCFATPIGMALECFAVGCGLGLPVLAATLLLARLSTAQAWLLGAAAAGLTGNLVLQVLCPIVDVPHLLAGHASLATAFVLVAGGVAAARRRLFE